MYSARFSEPTAIGFLQSDITNKAKTFVSNSFFRILVKFEEHTIRPVMSEKFTLSSAGCFGKQFSVGWSQKNLPLFSTCHRNKLSYGAEFIYIDSFCTKFTKFEKN